MDKIEKVLLDNQSRTSVKLVQLLAEKLWNINPEWEVGTVDFMDRIGGTTAGVVIGDRTFGLTGRFPHVFDLSEEWKKLTGLPFVFACWVSNRPLSSEFIQQFENALSFGLANKRAALEAWSADPSEMKFRYLNDVISYELDHKKQEAMKLFLAWLSKSP
jgi:chorismate dehydratase